MDIVLAMPPPMPLPTKVIITIAMAWLMFVFARLRGARRPLLPAMQRSALIASSIVIVLEFSFPSRFDPGWDRLGLLAALIGLIVGGIVASRTLKDRPRQSEPPAEGVPHADA
ncbi:MAG: hypothetical protein ACYTGL_24730 [Planctomycetota bacterium]|jgi:hypothetical protein